MRREALPSPRRWVAAVALMGALAIPATASAGVFDRLVIDLQGPGADDAIVSFAAVDSETGSVVTEVNSYFPTWFPFLALVRMQTVLPHVGLGDHQYWAARVDARFATGPVWVKRFKFKALFAPDRDANVTTDDLAGTCEWFLIGDEVGE
ncbi:MAG: hypothetical protein H6744_19875 [Deltaproteobacteria bacterium]|nr:hypothetical protein [Deltaproteobacteria bacterium]MCB9788942.1 hypothetical protein [Deltaproteobacteria bacterium]